VQAGQRIAARLRQRAAAGDPVSRT